MTVDDSKVDYISHGYTIHWLSVWSVFVGHGAYKLYKIQYDIKARMIHIIEVVGPKLQGLKIGPTVLIIY